MLGLPDDTRACLFDLDGVLTDTAAVHAAAWKQMFDGFLAGQGTFEDEDYTTYVDGKRREDGVRSFLHSREIDLPDGSPDDPPGARTVYGLGNRKNALVLKVLADKGVVTFDGSIAYVRAVRAAGLRTAVVSSSANTRQVLEKAGIADLFEARVDGVTAAERGLASKPDPAMFLAGAEALDVPADRAVVFEDALAGVQAGRAGGFALVVGVDRVGGDHADKLREHGADVVVTDLAELK
ncbi:MAG: beta-phosphoglucomutase family hydrolase [Streptosporangiaceae bacterium]